MYHTEQLSAFRYVRGRVYHTSVSGSENRSDWEYKKCNSPIHAGHCPYGSVGWHALS